MSDVKLVVIGSTGSGKSSLCNVLAGLDCRASEDEGGFPVSEKLSAGTYKTTCREVKWLGKGENIMLIDTPGLGDPEGKDTEHIAEMVDKLKEVRHVNLFLIIFNAQRPRMDSSLRSMFTIFQGIFGPGFWSNTAILFSRWAFDSRSERQRQSDRLTTKNLQAMVNGYFRSSFNLHRSIPCLFVDSCYMPEDPAEAEAFARETQRLHDILMIMQQYECKDFEKVLSERDDLMKKTDIAIKEKETAENKAEIATAEKLAMEKKLSEEREIRQAQLKDAELKEMAAQNKTMLLDEQRRMAERETEAVKEQAAKNEARILQELTAQKNTLTEEAKKREERLREDAERITKEANEAMKREEHRRIEAERRAAESSFESHPSLTTTDDYSKKMNRTDPEKLDGIESSAYAASWQTLQAREYFLQHCQSYSLVCEQLKKCSEIIITSSIAEETGQQQVMENLRKATFDDMKKMQILQDWLSLSSKCKQDKNLRKMVALAQRIWNIKIQAVKELFDSQYEVNLPAARKAIERLLEFFGGQRMLDILNNEMGDGETN